MNDSRWVIFVAISRLVFARNLDITILELQNSICFPAVLGNIMLFDSDWLCYFCDSIPCWKLDTFLAETASHKDTTFYISYIPTYNKTSDDFVFQSVSIPSMFITLEIPFSSVSPFISQLEKVKMNIAQFSSLVGPIRPGCSFVFTLLFV